MARLAASARAIRDIRDMTVTASSIASSRFSARAPRLEAGRMVVPDVLRGVAIVAMLVAHAGRLIPERPGPVSFVMANLNDVASPLFALVMGMTAQLVYTRLASSGGVRASDRLIHLAQNAVRALILIALGLWMSDWGSWIAIVLQFLGVVLLLGTPILMLRSWIVAAIAGVLWVVSEPLNAAVRAWVITTPGLNYPAHLALDWLFLNPSYRVTNLLPFFLVGALLFRHGFARDRLLAILLAVAAVAYPLRPIAERVFDVNQFVSGSYFDTLHDVGLVFAAYVVVAWLSTVKSPRGTRVIAVAFTPLRAVGSVALSVYVAHVALVAWWANTSPPTGLENDWIRWSILVIGSVALGWLWWRFIGKGPIEWLMGAVTARHWTTRKPQKSENSPQSGA